MEWQVEARRGPRRNRGIQPGSPGNFWITSLLFASMLAGGCGGSSSKSSTGSLPPSTGSPVIVGTQPNSLPTPPQQSGVNRYAGVDVATGGPNWNWRISHPNGTYNYQEEEGVGAVGAVFSGGTFSSFGDFEYLTDTTSNPPVFSGLGAEINGAIGIFDDAYGGFPPGSLAVGVVQQQTGCLAPDGTAPFDYVIVPSVTAGALTYRASTDALYGHAGLTYAGGTFSYTNVSQTTISGSAASTLTVPFADSVCIQANAGYGIQSKSAIVSGLGTETLLTYVGDTGSIVGSTEYTVGGGGNAGATGSISWVGAVEPSSAVNLSSVTSGTYKGFYNQRSAASTYADPAYFGQTSAWVSGPVFNQSSGTLVGGYEDFYTYLFTTPAPTVTGNILINFGAQDSNHPGVFPMASFTEQDPSNLCPASEQSVGSDGNTYCTFPVVALVTESYGKYSIVIAGPEPTTSSALYYVLVED